MKSCWKGCFKQSKLQNFLCLPTMVVNRIFRHIPTDCPEFEMTARKWNHLIIMTAGIQNVISSIVFILDPKFCLLFFIFKTKNKKRDTVKHLWFYFSIKTMELVTGRTMIQAITSFTWASSSSTFLELIAVKGRRDTSKFPILQNSVLLENKCIQVVVCQLLSTFFW